MFRERNREGEGCTCAVHDVVVLLTPVVRALLHPEEVAMAGREYDIYKTVTARFWPSLSGQSPENLRGKIPETLSGKTAESQCSFFARKRTCAVHDVVVLLTPVVRALLHPEEVTMAGRKYGTCKTFKAQMKFLNPFRSVPCLLGSGPAPYMTSLCS
jgi:hypothetical protein